MSGPAGKRKAYVAVLVLAVVAFVCDRMLFDPSTTEPAAATAALRQRQNQGVKKKPASAASAQAGPDAMAPRTDAAETISFNTRIIEACRRVDVEGGDAECSDAMRPSAVWIAREQESQESQAAKTPPEQTALESLQSRYALTAVVSGASGMAILGDRCVRVGQSIDGCTLVEVQGDRAIFEVGEHRIELKVPQ